MLALLFHLSLTVFFTFMAVESTIGHGAVVLFVMESLPAAYIRLPLYLPTVRQSAYLDSGPGVSITPLLAWQVLPPTAQVNWSFAITPASRQVYTPPEPTFLITEGDFVTDLVVYVPPVVPFKGDGVLAHLVCLATELVTSVCPWSNISDISLSTELVVYDPSAVDIGREVWYKFWLSALATPSWAMATGKSPREWLRALTVLSILKSDITPQTYLRTALDQGSSSTGLVARSVHPTVDSFQLVVGWFVILSHAILFVAVLFPRLVLDIIMGRRASDMDLHDDADEASVDVKEIGSAKGIIESYIPSPPMVSTSVENTASLIESLGSLLDVDGIFENRPFWMNDVHFASPSTQDSTPSTDDDIPSLCSVTVSSAAQVAVELSPAGSDASPDTEATSNDGTSEELALVQNSVVTAPSIEISGSIPDTPLATTSRRGDSLVEDGLDEGDSVISDSLGSDNYWHLALARELAALGITVPSDLTTGTAEDDLDLDSDVALSSSSRRRRHRFWSSTRLSAASSSSRVGSLSDVRVGSKSPSRRTVVKTTVDQTRESSAVMATPDLGRWDTRPRNVLQLIRQLRNDTGPEGFVLSFKTIVRYGSKILLFLLFP